MKTVCLTARQRALSCDDEVPLPAFVWAALWTFLLIAALAEPGRPAVAGAPCNGAAESAAAMARPRLHADAGLDACPAIAPSTAFRFHRRRA